MRFPQSTQTNYTSLLLLCAWTKELLSGTVLPLKCILTWLKKLICEDKAQQGKQRAGLQKFPCSHWDQAVTSPCSCHALRILSPQHRAENSYAKFYHWHSCQTIIIFLIHPIQHLNCVKSYMLLSPDLRRFGKGGTRRVILLTMRQEWNLSILLMNGNKFVLLC